jgi:hypothetical protein
MKLRTLLACLLCCANACAPLCLLAAEGAPSAQGTFKSKDVAMDVRGAVAFHGTSMLGKGADVIIVAVTNARLKPVAIADYVDRRLAIERHVKDVGTGVVYLEFRGDATYRGFGYYFESGNGCGFCTGEVTSDVRLVDGRLRGTIKDAEKDRSFDIALDVPVMSDDHGSALPADGGDPGSAYRAYHAALTGNDRAAIKPLLSAELQQTWVDAEHKGDIGGFIEFLLAEHPTRSVRVISGYARADKAVLLIAGQSAVGKLAGEVMLVNEKGTWRVDDELTALVFE